MSKDQAEMDQLMLNLAEKYLLALDHVDKGMVSAYHAPIESRPKTLSRICFILCASLKKKQKHEHVFQQTIGRLNKLTRVLCDFDPLKIIEKYQKGDWEKMVEAVQLEVMFEKEPNPSEQSVIPQFCKGVLSAAYFFHQFHKAQDFYEWVDAFKQDEKARLDLPTLLSQEVHGLGFALATDFLKEIGYNGFGKPDAKTKAIFSELGLIPTGEDTEQDAATFEAIARMARNTGRTAYEVDKIFWLLGTGYFYKHGITIASPKNGFIAAALEVLGQEQESPGLGEIG